MSRKHATFSLDEVLLKRLMATCALLGMTASDVLECLLQDWLKKNEMKARENVDKKQRE
jgi:antitoxin component of RelBE/YafQ-DinJ toxin-antitoxin module